LSEGYPYGGLGTRERVAVLKALCDAYASSYGCATLVDEASELRALRDAKAEADERERKRTIAEKEKETASMVREKLAAEMGCELPPEMEEKKPRKKSASRKTSDGGKRPRPRPGAAPPPLSALLDHLINIDAPCSVDQRNPKLPGSRVHALYERYRSATTIKEMLRLGARRGDIFNDIARGYTSLTTPLHARQYSACRQMGEDDAIPDFTTFCVDGSMPSPDDEVAAATTDLQPSSQNSSPRASPPAQVAAPTRHRFRAEIAHARAVDACGGGDIEFVASIPALERKESEWGLQSRTEALRDARRKCIVTLRDACKPGEHGVDVELLKKALAEARSEDVLLEGLVPEEESDEPPPPPKGQDDPAPGWFRKCEPRKSSDKVDVYYYPPDGVQLRSRPDVRRYFEGKPHMAQIGDRTLDPQVDFCFSEEPVPKVPEVPPKRWVCREVADACEALRDAEAKFDEIARRRAKVRDIRARALPRLEPLGYDRNKNAYWVFPRRDTLAMESVPKPRPASPLRIWVEDRSGQTPAWSFYEGTEVLKQLAASLDDRGVRERALKDALADHLPVFGLDDVDD